MSRGHEGVSDWAKWAVAAMVAATLLVLMYQRSQRADYVEPGIRAADPGEPPDVVEAPGRLPVSSQRKGVAKTGPVVLEQEGK